MIGAAIPLVREMERPERPIEPEETVYAESIVPTIYPRRMQASQPPGYGRQYSSMSVKWKYTVAEWIAHQLGRPACRQLGWIYLRRLGARLRVPRPRHVHA